MSVVTAAELELGVLRAHDAAARATRVSTLSRVRSEYSLLPIDDATASCFARIADEELRAGRKLRRHDTWIAATALRHQAAVLTQDADFGPFRSVTVIRVRHAHALPPPAAERAGRTTATHKNVVTELADDRRCNSWLPPETAGPSGCIAREGSSSRRSTGSSGRASSPPARAHSAAADQPRRIYRRSASSSPSAGRSPTSTARPRPTPGPVPTPSRCAPPDALPIDNPSTVKADTDTTACTRAVCTFRFLEALHYWAPGVTDPPHE